LRKLPALLFWGLVEIVIATIAGAWVYKEAWRLFSSPAFRSSRDARRGGRRCLCPGFETTDPCKINGK
jgi:hypothetical protein